MDRLVICIVAGKSEYGSSCKYSHDLTLNGSSYRNLICVIL